MQPERSMFKVGALVIVAMAVMMLGVVLIGDQNNLFRKMNEYTVRLKSVQGLQAGNPVQLNGVSVGRVTGIDLPKDPGELMLVVSIDIDRRYAERVRKDSKARIQTLGLLGDKFIALTSGTEEAAVIPDGGEIPVAPATNVDKLIESGEDVMANVLGISANLDKLLMRLENGQSLVGQLLAPVENTEGEPTITESVHGLFATLDHVAKGLESGKSPISRLLFDETMGRKLATSVERLEAMTAGFETGNGLAPTLLHDETLVVSLRSTLSELEQTASRLNTMARDIEQAEGLLPRLLDDDAYADELLGKLDSVIDDLHQITGEVASGEGTAGMLLRDPEVYEAINDVVVGVNESRMLRWLIRNRQKAGIKKRYNDATENESVPFEPPEIDNPENDTPRENL